MIDEKVTPPNKVQAGPIVRKSAAVVTAIQLTPKEIIGIVRRHMIMIVFFTILGLTAGGGAWYGLLTYFPKYTAQTAIKVLPPIEKDPMSIAGGTVGKDLQYASRLSMAGIIKQQSTLQTLIERKKIQDTKWFQSFGEIKDKRIARAIGDLDKHFVASAQRDGDFVMLAMTCGNKEEAALIVNEMMDLFLLMQSSSSQSDIAAKLSGLQEQKDRVQRDLDSSERALADVRKSYGFTDLEEHDYQNIETRKLNDLELEQNQVALAISQLISTIETLRRQATGPIAEQVKNQIETDPVMTLLAQNLAIEEARLASRLTRFGENHIEIQRARELINETIERRNMRKAEIAEQTRQSNLKDAEDQLAGFESRYTELNKLLKEAAAKKTDLDLARVQYDQRITIRDERKDMLDLVKGQIEKLKIMHDDPETPKVKSLGYAPVPLEASFPKWQIFFPGGMMLGFMFGLGLAFMIELLNDLVRTPRDVVRYLHIPLLGVIPDADEDKQTRKIDLHHVVSQAPYSFTSESYKRFRTNLKLSPSSKSSKIFLVSSGAAGDGKTSVAINLAEAFVADGKKVLLIDANFWRPALNKLFPKPQQSQHEDIANADWGLGDLLIGRCNYNQAVRASDIENLHIIDAGTRLPNSAELIGSSAMHQLLEQQRDSYDYIIVDGPPILLVGDTAMLAKLVDGTILVFSSFATKRGAALRTISDLKKVDAKILGCILFAVQTMKGGYFREQFKTYEKYQELQLAHSS